ncbi:MAG: hypothetical protein FD165_904 [Gammaproteobacteria bacterium]|nr:MAG: hypothetical protein FD165_904 [Gammaproteobacteria bacterium]TND06387.1 MAG: hypothetical protein FD120_874 [Gammaproteobacteria bacterium]
MRAKDKERLGALRLCMAAIKQREVDERITLDDTQVLAVLDKMIKQRRDSIEQYRAAGRDDLAAKESFETAVLQEYLPPALTDTELSELIARAISQVGASSAKDMGKVMGALKPQVQGRADMNAVGAKVKERLASL